MTALILCTRFLDFFSSLFLTSSYSVWHGAWNLGWWCQIFKLRGANLPIGTPRKGHEHRGKSLSWRAERQNICLSLRGRGEIKVLCPESRMYQLELAGLEIFHWLYFPERSPSFPLCASLSLSLSLKLCLLFLVVRSHCFIFPTCDDKPFMYTLNKSENADSGKKRMQCMKAMW